MYQVLSFQIIKVLERGQATSTDLLWIHPVVMVVSKAISVLVLWFYSAYDNYMHYSTVV